jgi:hypothetical protein
VKKRYLAEGDDLGLPWERWSDGRPHRLKRNRDFGDLDLELVREAAKNAAARMGKGVLALEDKMGPKSQRRSKYLWVQFADHEIRVGEPCKCGGRRLVRIHPSFARCTRCGAQLLLSPPKPGAAAGIDSADDEDDDDEDRPEPAGLLRTLTDVHLARLEHVGDRETYRGYGRLGGKPALVIAQFRAAPGERLRAADALSRAAAVQVLPLQQLEGLVDASALVDPNAEWDLVL